ncbi:unnamed protein product [Mytilus edulis]|uniref:Integrase zinc-binding domain-containing protein n=1 Tax=Mytilus edulis TaxID=6550 RepID=A0A8S3RX68_MYTED|nr:unnamed protein product [Mytilus edulis]
MVARWISLLDTYDFEIKHRRGAAHGNADALSRQIHVTRHCKRPDCPQCIPNTEVTVGAITQKNVTSDINNELNNELLGPSESNWLEQWTPPILQKLQMEDETISTVISYLEQNNTKPCIRSQNQDLVTLLRQWDQLSIENGLLYRRYTRIDDEVFLQLVAPKAIRLQIMQQLHNNRTAGHLGREKTLGKLRSRFYWPGMTNDVIRWCQTCGPCARSKPGPGIESLQCNIARYTVRWNV